MVVGDAAIPVGTGWRTGNVLNAAQHERDRATGLQRRAEIGFDEHARRTKKKARPSGRTFQFLTEELSTLQSVAAMPQYKRGQTAPN